MKADKHFLFCFPNISAFCVQKKIHYSFLSKNQQNEYYSSFVYIAGYTIYVGTFKKIYFAGGCTRHMKSIFLILVSFYLQKKNYKRKEDYNKVKDI